MTRILIALILFTFKSAFAANVGLLIMATGKYVNLVPPLVKSAKKHFCQNHNVTYFVFTDGELETSENVVRIQQNRLGWPYDTMHRFKVYASHSDLLSSQDYLFACDADMLFVDTVGDEILSDLVGTMHPGFLNKRGSYETNPISTARVKKNEGKYYFAGGFYGGLSSEVLKLAAVAATNIDIDLSKGFIAKWHDESHLNRYFIDHPPTLVLSPSYCYPEKWKLPYKKRLLALDKNHSDMRKDAP